MKKLMTLALGLAFVLARPCFRSGRSCEDRKEGPKKSKKAPKKDDATPAPRSRHLSRAFSMSLGSA